VVIAAATAVNSAKPSRPFPEDGDYRARGRPATEAAESLNPGATEDRTAHLTRGHPAAAAADRRQLTDQTIELCRTGGPAITSRRDVPGGSTCNPPISAIVRDQMKDKS